MHMLSCSSLWRWQHWVIVYRSLRARREVFAVPPWQLLTLVPVATLASVWPLMQLSHARRQIRELRSLPSVSNRSPQQPDLSLTQSPRAVHWLLAARNLNVISRCMDSHLRPSRPSGSDSRLLSTLPSCATLSWHIPNTIGGSGSLEPCLTWEPNRFHNGDAPAKRRHAPCFCYGDTLPHIVSLSEGCGAPQDFETISAKPSASAIDQSGASACAIQPVTAMLGPCHIAECLVRDSHYPCPTPLAGRLLSKLSRRQIDQTHPTTSIGSRKVSSAGMIPRSPRAPSQLVFDNVVDRALATS